MVVDDDSKENIVSPIAAKTLSPGDLMQPATSTSPIRAAAESTGHEGLATLFREHYRGVFGVALRITGSHSDAEDVLQTIFVRLTRGWSGRDIAPNPRAFLYRAAINASLDVVRLRKRANSVPLELLEFEFDPKSSAPTPEEHLADAELRELLRQAVAKLEGRAASAFVLRYYEGYDNRQIAEMLGTSQLTIAVTLHRARTRLRKEIGNYLEKHHEAK